MVTKFCLGVAFTALATFSAFAADPASDNASNYPGGTWDTTTNGGVGFSNWTFNTTGTGGRFIGTTGDGGSSFGVYAGGDAGNSSNAERSFTNGPMLSGQTFSFTIGSTGVSSTGPGVVGFNLLASGSPVFTFKFTGGQSVWQLNDGGSDFNTNIPFSASTPINFSFTYNGGNGYSVLITEGGTTYNGPNYTATSNLTNITGFRFFSNAQGAGENLGFNNLALSAVPEPSSLSLLAGPAILGAWFYVRRRRA